MMSMSMIDHQNDLLFSSFFKLHAFFIFLLNIIYTTDHRINRCSANTFYYVHARMCLKKV